MRSRFGTGKANSKVLGFKVVNVREVPVIHHKHNYQSTWWNLSSRKLEYRKNNREAGRHEDSEETYNEESNWDMG